MKKIIVLLLIGVIFLFGGCYPNDNGEAIYAPEFNPNANNTGSLGTPLLYWGDAYITNINGAPYAGGGFANPMTALGDIIYGGAVGAPTALAGDASNTNKFLRSLSIGGVPQAPSWQSVTKADVGLGSVENTALSTWAGSANITTLGTIVSGVWHGTAIDDAYISSAATWNAKMANPMTLLGDTVYGGALGAPTVLTGDTSNIRKFIRELSVAGVATAPVWDTVTKTDVGLGSVENTALSTWAGTSNITTLGTIGTGVWHGTAIAPAYGGTGVGNGANNTITFTGNYTLGITLSNNTSVTFPTSGTLATTTDLGSYVPYTGATGNVNLNAKELSNAILNNVTLKGTFTPSGNMYFGNSKWVEFAQAYSGSWYNATYSRQLSITLDNTAGAASTTNAIVYVSITPVTFDYSQAKVDGSDVVFVNSDNSTLLTSSIVTWTIGGTSTFKVTIPTLTNTNYVIYAYWGTP